MRLEIEFHRDDQRWYWHVYGEGLSADKVLREGFARSLTEANNAGEIAAGEYRSRKVIEL